MSVLLTLPESDVNNVKYDVDKGKERLAFREAVWRFYHGRRNETEIKANIKFGVLIRTNSTMT